MHCGQLDSQQHRLFQCPFYDPCRLNLPMEQLQSLPQLQTHKGLLRKPYAVACWEKLVTDLPAPNFYLEFDDHVNIFTDGSTFAQKTVPCSAWSVVLAEPHRMDATAVETGWLHGPQIITEPNFVQFWWLSSIVLQLHFFVDNEAVVLGLHRLQQFGWQASFWSSHDHCDLWWLVWSCWKDKHPLLWEVHHVRSHQDVAKAKMWRQAWCIYNNAVADAAAQKRNKERPRDHRSALALARMEFQRVKQQAAYIFSLQRNVLSQPSKASLRHSSLRVFPM